MPVDALLGTQSRSDIPLTERDTKDDESGEVCDEEDGDRDAPREG